MQKHYELTYIVSIKYLEDELKQVMEQVAGLIKEFGGVTTSEQILGKQRLAFPIKFTHQGTYVVVEFDMESENLKKLDDLLKLKNEVLRHLTILKRVRTADEIKREKELQEKLRKEKEDELKEMEQKSKDRFKKDAPHKTVKRAEVKTTEVETTESVEAEEKPVAVKKDVKKVSMEDIDKKIDEILTEEIL